MSENRNMSDFYLHIKEVTKKINESQLQDAIHSAYNIVCNEISKAAEKGHSSVFIELHSVGFTKEVSQVLATKFYKEGFSSCVKNGSFPVSTSETFNNYQQLSTHQADGLYVSWE